MTPRPIRAVQRLAAPALAPAAARKLRHDAAAARTLEATIDLAYSFSFFGIAIAPMQVRSELEGFLAAIPQAPRAVLEIGTAGGGTLFTLVRSAAPDAIVVSVDLPDGEFGGGYPRWRETVYRTFTSRGQRLTLIRDDSHLSETVAAVKQALSGRLLDVLLIDGDHAYEGVRQDFEMYSDLVSHDGVIAFHDIVPQAADRDNGPSLLVGGVPGFWRDLRRRYNTVELVADWGQGGYGIGLIPLGGDSGNDAAGRLE